MAELDCVIPRPDIAGLRDQLAAELSTRLLGGAPVLPYSAEDVLSFVMAGTANLMHGYVTQALREADPATMCCDNLVTYGAMHGFDLRGASRAKGYVQITGTAGTPVPATMRFVGGSSREYKLDPAVTSNPATLDADGKASLRIVSVGIGAVMNVLPGTMMTVASTTPGISGTATVIGSGIVGGADEETCEQLRARILAYQASGIIAANQQWYIAESMRYPGVTRVCAEQCVGCCDPTMISLYPFMDGVYEPNGVPPQEVIDEMNLWMWGPKPGMGEGIAPVGMIGSYSQALPSPVNMVLDCFRGCEPGTIDRVRAALEEFIAERYCVGSTICKAHLRGVIYAAAGADNCFSEVDFDFGDTVEGEDAANVYLACGFFLTVGEITLGVTPLPVGVQSR